MLTNKNLLPANTHPRNLDQTLLLPGQAMKYFTHFLSDLTKKHPLPVLRNKCDSVILLKLAKNTVRTVGYGKGV